MGVDIRLHVEISHNGSKYWEHAAKFKPNPNPYFFGALSEGIRGNEMAGFYPRGLPEDVTYQTLSDWGAFSESAPEQGVILWGEAFRPSWLKKSIRGNYYPYVGTFRDSYLSPDEFEESLTNAWDAGESTEVPTEWSAMLFYMRELEREYTVRVIYFFDN